MCGIIGGFIDNYDDSYRIKIKKTLNDLNKRGPDFSDYKLHDLLNGKLLLGHTRLSIIDLSQNSNQPMYSSNGRYGLIFNGEIINYLELKLKLQKLGIVFSTTSDTEVLLKAWEYWKEKTIELLEGMFAFAIFDFKDKKLTLVKDAFGIKPLYYEKDKNNFIFSSEIKAIRSINPNKDELNWQRSYEYLVFGEYDFGNETFYKNIKSLEPGHYLEIDYKNFKGLKINRWWKPKIKEQKISFLDAKNILRETLLENISKNLRSDVKIGAALSGGIDSSSIVCAIKHLEPDVGINTFSYVPNDINLSEEYWIDVINSHTKSVSHKFNFSNEELINDFDKLILAQGEPFAGTSIYASYRLYKLAKEKGVTVTLDGQGADEILGGYNGFPGYRLHSMIDNREFISAFKFLNAWSRYPKRSKYDAIKRLVGSISSGKLNHYLRELNGMHIAPIWIESNLLEENGVKLGFPSDNKLFHGKGRRMVEYMAHSTYHRGLNSLLRHGDRNSMRFSVESRVPFLTTNLANFSLSLPEQFLVSDQGQTKHLFREAMRGIVPDEVLDRKEKIGFATPEKDIFFEMQDNIETWLNVDLNIPFINQEVIKKEFKRVLSKKKPFNLEIWRWINFYRWYQLSFSNN